MVIVHSTWYTVRSAEYYISRQSSRSYFLAQVCRRSYIYYCLFFYLFFSKREVRELERIRVGKNEIRKRKDPQLRIIFEARLMPKALVYIVPGIQYRVYMLSVRAGGRV